MTYSQVKLHALFKHKVSRCEVPLSLCHCFTPPRQKSSPCQIVMLWHHALPQNRHQISIIEISGRRGRGCSTGLATTPNNYAPLQQWISPFPFPFPFPFPLSFPFSFRIPLHTAHRSSLSAVWPWIVIEDPSGDTPLCQHLPSGPSCGNKDVMIAIVSPFTRYLTL